MAKILPVHVVAILAVVGGLSYLGFHGINNQPATANTVVGADRGEKVVSGKEQVQAAYAGLAPQVQPHYAKLRDLLQQRQWEAADAETTERLLEAAGKDAQDRGYLNQQEMSSLSANDLKAVNVLWSASSHDRFGFDKQAYILKKYGNSWQLMYKKTGWQEVDGKATLTWQYNKSSHRYEVASGLDKKLQNEGQYPTFNRGYNTQVSLDSRLVQVGFGNI